MAREVQETSVHHTPVARGFDEDAPLIELDDPQTEEITAETCGGLKRVCERTAAELFGADTSGDQRLSVPRVQVAGLSLEDSSFRLNARTAHPVCDVIMAHI